MTTVLILGAGASYGSSVRPAPPLMSNFIREGRVRIGLHDYSRLWRFLEREGYSLATLESGNPNLEDLFDLVWSVTQDIPELGSASFEYQSWYRERFGPDFRWHPPVVVLESFILEVLAESSRAAISVPCHRTSALIRQELQPSDAIISFNYDLIVDAALRGSGLWNESTGYGFSPCNKHAFKGWPSSRLVLLKPHGSLNWWPDIDQNGICVTPLLELADSGFSGLLHVVGEELLTLQQQGIFGIEPDEVVGNPHTPKRRTLIVPPAFDKIPGTSTLSALFTIWREMESALSGASRIICIGYSFPPADREFARVFRKAVASNPKCECVVVEPNDAVLERIRALVPGLRVNHAARTLEEYVT